MWKNNPLFYLRLRDIHWLPLSQKIQLIRENEEKLSYRTLADNYKIWIGSVSNIMKRKAKYIESYEQKKAQSRSAQYAIKFS